jgi:VWFA-related protein
MRCLRYLPAIVVLAVGLPVLVGSTRAQETVSTPAQLKVTSNLVVVRVVVSDANGRPVIGLREGDFKVFDRGKEQSIVHFEVEPSAPLDKNTVGDRSPEQSSSAPASEVSGPRVVPTPSRNYLALYFDNLSTTVTDLTAARNAAERYLSSSLKPSDRVAIFSSDQLVADFTDDTRRLAEALGNLHVSVRARMSGSDCPNLSDYQALQITELAEEPHADAWVLARDEMAQCSIPSGSSNAAENSTSRAGKAGGKGTSGHLANESFDRDSDVAHILNLARGIVLQNQIVVRSNLQEIDRVVQRLSQMPGQRSVILVSPGFLTQTEQLQLDRIVDHALRSEVVISALDPKGLAILTRSADASLGYTPTHGDAARASRAVDSGRENAVTSVLAEVAQGTGGKYFHSSNDLKAGFAALERSPGYYVLAFAPTDLKPDGAFHSLKVTLTGDRKDFTIQARRGYFAPKGDAPVAASADNGNDLAEHAEHERMQQQVLSKVDVSQLPVELTSSLAQQTDQTQILSVSIHLDTKALQFRREGDHNLNTITFVVAVFDPKDKIIGAQQRHVSVDSSDAQLRDVLRVGLETAFAFKLGSGAYRLRAVVTDSVQHLVGAKSDSVIVP